MKTFKRICLRDYTVTDGKESFTLERGKEYITSEVGEAPSIVFPYPMEKNIVVFTKYWFHAPAEIFGGEIKFT